jgi:hypothetical protein
VAHVGKTIFPETCEACPPSAAAVAAPAHGTSPASSTICYSVDPVGETIFPETCEACPPSAAAAAAPAPGASAAK